MEEEKKKDNFILYNEDYSMIEELSDEDVGSVIKSIFRYSINNEFPEYNKGTGKSILFKHIQRTIDINNKKYIEKCMSNKQKALKRWKKIIYNNEEFTKESYTRFCKEHGFVNEFDDILLSQKTYFDNGDYTSIKNLYNNNLVSNETIDKIFQ